MDSGYYCYLIITIYRDKFCVINNKWYIGSVDKESPAVKDDDITGKEVVAIGEWRISGYDLAKNPSLIPDREDYLHYRTADDYFIQYLLPGHTVNITIVENHAEKQVSLTPVVIPPTIIFSHIFSFVLTAFITLTAGILIIFKRPDDTRAPAYSDYPNGINPILIAHGADINVKNNDGDTPLYRAVYQGNITVVEFLVGKGAD